MKSFRRIIAAVLSSVMVLLMMPHISFEATAQTTSLYDLQSRYPDGKYWNHYVSSVANCGDQLGARNDESYGGSVTSTPCASHSATSAEYYVGKYDCNYFDGAWQCQGFARRLGFEAFGTKVTTWSKHNSVANIKPGDVIQFWSPDTDPTWGHGVFVTAVSGSIITVAEANLYGDPCRIRWGHQYNLSTAYKVEVYSAPGMLDSGSSVPQVEYTTISAGDYYLRNNSTGKYLAVDGGIDAEQQNISVADFTGGSEMKLAISAAASGYIMRPHCTNRIVNPYGDAVVAGMNVSLLGDLSDSSQWWGFEKVSGGYIIRNMQNQNCVLSVDGTNVVTANYTGNSEQIWSLDTNAGFTVTYDANGGNGAPEQQVKGYNQSLTIPSTTPTREGHTFVGWGASSTSTTPSYFSGSSYTANMSITLYAIWRAHTYTVSYDSNGGSGSPSPQIKTYGKNLILDTTVPNRTGYSFLGWATSSTATSASYQPGDTYTANSDVTLYAVWEGDSYTVSYNANGGTGAPEPQTKTHGQSLTLSSTVPTREGYIFVGWATNSITDGVSYQPGGSYVANDGVTLYAVWEREVYTTYFDPNGGNISTSNRYVRREAGETEIVFPTEIPTKDYCYFLGWSSANNSKEAEYLPGETIIAQKNEDLIFYAVWEEPTDFEVDKEYSLALNTARNEYCYVFTAPESAYYMLRATGTQDGTYNNDARIVIYDNINCIVYEDEDYVGYDSSILYLEEGQKYYLSFGVAYWSALEETFCYTVELETTNITHITVQPDKTVYYSPSQEYRLSDYDPIVTIYAGETVFFTGTIYQLNSELGIELDSRDVLSAGTSVGIYTLEYEIGNLTDSVSVTVEQPPVVEISVSVNEKIIEHAGSFSSLRYSDSGITYTITLDTGEVLKGTETDIEIQLNNIFGRNFGEMLFDDSQAEADGWAAGTYTITLELMGFVTTFDVEVISNPVESVKIVSAPISIKEYTYGYFDNDHFVIDDWNSILQDHPVSVEIVYTDGTTKELTIATSSYAVLEEMGVSLSTTTDYSNNEYVITIQSMGISDSMTIELEDNADYDPIVSCQLASTPQHSGTYPLNSLYDYSGTKLEMTLESGRTEIVTIYPTSGNVWWASTTVDGYKYYFYVRDNFITAEASTCHIEVLDEKIVIAELPASDITIQSVDVLTEPKSKYGVGASLRLHYSNGMSQDINALDFIINQSAPDAKWGYVRTDCGFFVSWAQHDKVDEHIQIVYVCGGNRIVYDFGDSNAKMLALIATAYFNDGYGFEKAQTQENIDKMILATVAYFNYNCYSWRYDRAEFEVLLRQIFDIEEIDLTKSSYYSAASDTLAGPEWLCPSINIFTDGVELYKETGQSYIYRLSLAKIITESGAIYIEINKADNRIEFIGESYAGKEVVAVDVIKMPAKTEYFVGDSLELSDLELEITYADDRKEKVTEGFAVSGFDAYSAGIQPLAITYGDMLVNLEITVIRPQVQLPQEDLILHKGEILKLDTVTNPEGQMVEWHSANKYVADVVDGEVVAKGVGTTTITVEFTYNGITYSSSCEVSVEEIKLTGISISNGPVQTVYELGSLLDTAGLELTLTYSDGSTKVATEGFVVKGFDSETVGEKILTITYEDFMDTFSVTVKEPTLLGVVITKLPDKTEYEIGEDLDTTGLTLKATYSNGYSEEITEGFDVSGLDSTTAGTKSVTVTYGEEILIFQVVVKESVITSISIASEPDKVEYEIGEELNTAGMSLMLVYSDGSTATISDDFTVSGFDSTSVGAKTVTVTYGGKTTTFTVTVNEPIIDENAPQIIVDAVRNVAGNRAAVAISLKNNPGIVSATLQVDYDTTALTLVEVQDKGLLGSATHKPELVSPYTLRWANNTVTQNFTTNGAVVVLIFEIAENAAQEVYPITVTYDYDNYDIIDWQMNKVKFTVVNGSVEVIDVMLGDVNNDGSVDNRDSMILDRYLAKWDGYTTENVNVVAADVNCDGAVNNIDSMILARYLAKWEGYETLPYVA